MHAKDLCMFCLCDDGGFRSEEHVIPESLGNKTTLLEPGYICDRCNNGPLSVCDQALISCPPIALLKTSQFIRSKKNRLPRAEFDHAGLYALDDGTDNNIYLRLPHEDRFTEREGEFEIEVVKPWSERDWSRLSRAILKAGFEMLAHDNGKAYVMDERFDGLRKAILTGGYSGWILYNHTGLPSTEVSLSYPPFAIEGTGRSGLAAAVTVFGLRLGTAWPGREDVLQRFPDAPGFEDLRVVRFDRTPSKARDDITMRVTVTYGSREEWGDHAPVTTAVAEIDRRFPA